MLRARRSNALDERDMNTQMLKTLEAASAYLTPEHIEQLPQDRRAFFEGLAAMAYGQLEEAQKLLRKAQRQCEEPYVSLSALALGECERLRGKEGMALKAFKRLGQDEDALTSARYLAWSSVVIMEQARQDERAEALAKAALASLGYEPDL